MRSLDNIYDINLLFLWQYFFSLQFKDALPCFSAQAVKRVGAAPHKDDHTASAPRPRGIMRHIPSAANGPRPNLWKMIEHVVMIVMFKRFFNRLHTTTIESHSKSSKRTNLSPARCFQHSCAPPALRSAGSQGSRRSQGLHRTSQKGSNMGHLRDSRNLDLWHRMACFCHRVENPMCRRAHFFILSCNIIFDPLVGGWGAGCWHWFQLDIACSLALPHKFTSADNFVAAGNDLKRRKWRRKKTIAQERASKNPGWNSTCQQKIVFLTPWYVKKVFYPKIQSK